MSPSLHEIHKVGDVVLLLRQRCVAHVRFPVQCTVPAPYHSQDRFVDDHVFEIVWNLKFRGRSWQQLPIRPVAPYRSISSTPSA